jgi:hypothetical protein
MAVNSFMSLRINHDGTKAIFHAGGVNVVQDLSSSFYDQDLQSSSPFSTLDRPWAEKRTGVQRVQPTKIPTLYDDDGITPYYSPSFIYSSCLNETWIVHSRWSDLNFTSFEIAHLESGTAWEVEGLEMGRYLGAVVSPASGRSLSERSVPEERKEHTRRIAFLKTGKDRPGLSGNTMATANEGLWVGDLELPELFYCPSSSSSTFPPPSSTMKKRKPRLTNLTFIPTNIDTSQRVMLHWINMTMLMIEEPQRVFTVDLSPSAERDTGDRPPHRVFKRGRMSTELLLSPSLFATSQGSGGAGFVAFRDFLQLYVAPVDGTSDVAGLEEGRGEAVFSKPFNSTKGLARISKEGGHDAAWSGDGKRLFWFLGVFFLL